MADGLIPRRFLGAYMTRREFITLLGGTLAAAPLAALAQEAGRIYRLGILSSRPQNAAQFVSFFSELKKFGFVEGQNLIIDPRGFRSREEQYAERAIGLVKARVDVILASGNNATRAAQRATATIPILTLTDDVLRAGLVRSLAKPGGNTTGITILASELDGKRQEMLIELVPGARRIAALVDPLHTMNRELDALKAAAVARGVELLIYRIAKPDEVISAIDAAKTSGAEALNVLASPLLNSQRRIIIQRAATLRLPAIYQWPENAEAGGLIGYGPRILHLYLGIRTRQVVKVLRGKKPADIPVERPTKFDLVINLKTAKRLGITIPQTLLLRADKVIE